jgi:predicted ATPase
VQAALKDVNGKRVQQADRMFSMLTAVAISNYRSLRNIVVPMKQLNVVTGANGSGKSSFYRALRLLGDTAQGRVVPSLAREGGLQSTLWAGPESIARSVRRREYAVEGTPREQPVYLRLGFASDELGYLSLDQHTSNLFYQVISTRHSRKRSTVITTNTAFSD